MTEHTPFTHIPQDIAPEADRQRPDYHLLRSRYTFAVDSIMRIVIDDWMHETGVPGKDQVFDGVVWRVDGNIADGELNCAYRASARVQAAPKRAKPEHTPADALTPTVYGTDKRKNSRPHSYGKYGFYVLGIECRKVDLVPMGIRETVASALPHSQFTHKLPAGDVRYKANGKGGKPEDILTITPLPAYEQLTTNAHTAFVTAHANTVLDDDTRRSFTQAARQDMQRLSSHTPQPDDYRDATRGIADAKNRIRNLAGALYDAEADVAHPALIGQLLLPDAAETATWASLDKDSYHLEAFRRKDAECRVENMVHLARRLEWVQTHAASFQSTLRVLIMHNQQDFGRALTAELDTVAHMTATAEKALNYLSEPFSNPLDPRYWDTAIIR